MHKLKSSELTGTTELSGIGLFLIAPWSIQDPLFISTVLPHVKTLIMSKGVDYVRCFAVESERSSHQKIALAQILSSEAGWCKASFDFLPKNIFGSSPGRYIKNFLLGLGLLCSAVNTRRPNLIICRATTGIFGAELNRRFGIPYVVESFEPHAHYMLQTATWHRWNLKFLVQRRWETRVKQTASALITVSHGYARHLQEHEGIPPDRLHTVPCWVDAERFRIDPEARSLLRRQLGIGDRLAVVYAGKFGGIYSPLRELAMLRPLQQGLGQPLFVMVLTSAEAPAVCQQLRQAGFSADQVFVDCVPHDQVSTYLNAADLALSFINSGPWSFACSAIKHGEYWACGLPVLMPPGVGDEAQWLETERAGAIAPLHNPQAVKAAAVRLAQILAEPGHRQRIRAIGLRERGQEPLQCTYEALLERFGSAVGDE